VVGSAGGGQVGLGDAITGLDGANTARLLTAILHATGRRADANLVVPRRHDGPDALFHRLSPAFRNWVLTG
jgi:hypothetical protein